VIALDRLDETAQREALIRDLFPLVRIIARRVSRMVGLADVDDLVGDGCVGLIRAVDSFDPTRGTNLTRYARHIIAGAMLNGIRQRDPVSERVRRILRVAERERFALACERGVLPSMAEMERRVPDLHRARAEVHCNVPLSTDAPLPEKESPALDRDADPQLVSERDAERAFMVAAIAALPARQRTIILAHYFGERSLREIGDRLAVSPQRVSQLHLSAIARLRRTMSAAQLGDGP
jgi:RNA polymerase sigma factor for flagellar operon FliA